MSDSKRPPSLPRKITPTDLAAAPEPFESDDYTGRLELGSEELKQARSKRPTDERIGRLEAKHDELRADVRGLSTDVKDLGRHVGDLRETVGSLTGELKILPDLVKELQKAGEQTRHMTFTKIEVDAAREKAGIADELDAKKIERLDQLDAKKARRRVILKVIGSLFSAGVIGAIVHWLAGKL